MKKLILSLLLLLVTLFFGGCSSDSAPPKEQFKSDGLIVSLSKAKMYLIGQFDYSNVNGDFFYRNYFLTDGTYVDGDGFDIGNYTDATYVLAIQAIITDDSDFGSGSYPAVCCSFAPIIVNSAYFYAEVTSEGEYFESTEGESTATFVVTGDMEDGETVTIKFSGGVSHWIRVEGNWTETTASASMFVKAEVIDVSPI